MNNTLKLLFISLLFISFSCSSSKSVAKIEPKVDPLIGNWTVLVTDTPQGTIENTLTIAKNGEGIYTAILASTAGSMDLNNLVIVDSKMTSTFVYDGMDFELKGDFTANEFVGEVVGMGYNFAAKGTKVVE